MIWKNKKGQMDDESDRMERCPNAFAHYDPKKDKVGTVPTCAWAVFLKTVAMPEIVEYYGTASLPVSKNPVPVALREM